MKGDSLKGGQIFISLSPKTYGQDTEEFRIFGGVNMRRIMQLISLICIFLIASFSLAYASNGKNDSKGKDVKHIFRQNIENQIQKLRQNGATKAEVDQFLVDHGFRVEKTPQVDQSTSQSETISPMALDPSILNIPSQSVAYYSTYDEYRVESFYDFRDDYIGMEAPYDVMSVTIKDKDYFDITDTFTYNYDYLGNSYNSYIWLGETRPEGTIVYLWDQTSNFRSLTDHGSVASWISRRPGYNSYTYVGYNFEHNQGASLLSISIAWNFLSVSYNGSSLTLKKAANPVRIW